MILLPVQCFHRVFPQHRSHSLPFLPASSSPTPAPPDSLHSRCLQLQRAATLPLSGEERPLTDGHHPPLLFAPLLWPHLCEKYRQAENGHVIMDDLSLTSGSRSLWALPTALSVFPLCSIHSAWIGRVLFLLSCIKKKVLLTCL